MDVERRISLKRYWFAIGAQSAGKDCRRGEAENRLQDVDEERATHEYGAREIAVVCNKYSKGQVDDEM